MQTNHQRQVNQAQAINHQVGIEERGSNHDGRARQGSLQRVRKGDLDGFIAGPAGNGCAGTQKDFTQERDRGFSAMKTLIYLAPPPYCRSDTLE
jgi:hypothetical protein